MAKTPEEVAHDTLLRSINALERLHAVIIGLAFSSGARIALEPWLNPQPSVLSTSDQPGAESGAPWAAIALFVALCFTLVPFFHGATRHLDDVHLFSETPPNRFALLVDYAFLFLEGVLFIGIGLSVRSLPHFLLGFLSLVAVDGVWGAITWFLTTKDARKALKHIGRWIQLDLWTGVAGAAMWVLGSLVDPPWRPACVLAAAVVRTVFDYIANWEFYFDVPLNPPSGENSAAAPTLEGSGVDNR